MKSLFITATTALAITLPCRGVETADHILLNGRFITLDAREQIAEAMAIKGGRILAVGGNDEIRKLAGPDTKAEDLAGRTVLPGLIESHCHSIGAARASLSGEYRELYSIADIQEWIRERAKTAPTGSWIEVPRNEITRLKERRHPTPEELDAACTTHPVLFVSVTKSVLNTAGFQALGIVDEASTIPGGEVVREGGRPVLIRGGSAHIRSKMPPTPPPSREETMKALKRLHGVYNSVGITSIFERATDRDGVRMFEELRGKDELTVRMRGTFRFSAKKAGDVDAYVQKLGLKPGEGDDWIRATCLKITVDGGIHWGTTWLSEPYGEARTKFYRNTDPAYTGEKFYTPEQMREVFGRANELGWPISAHVTGDAGAMAVLDAVEAVAQTQPTMRDRRFNLIHCYFPSPEMVAKAKSLNAGLDTQSYLYYRDSDALAKIYGPPWAERFLGLASWVQGGVPVAINSDHMIGFDPDHAMNSFNPFLILYIAVSRKNDLGEVHGAHQKLSRLDALRAVTLWPAWLSFDEKTLGSLEPGKLADFVVIDRDYLACPEEEIRVIRPVRTVVGGRTVYGK